MGYALHSIVMNWLASHKPAAGKTFRNSMVNLLGWGAQPRNPKMHATILLSLTIHNHNNNNHNNNNNNNNHNNNNHNNNHNNHNHNNHNNNNNNNNK